MNDLLPAKHITFTIIASIVDGVKPTHQIKSDSPVMIGSPEDLDTAIQKLAIASDQIISELGKTLGILRKKP
jgi:hypothetical protein